MSNAARLQIILWLFVAGILAFLLGAWLNHNTASKKPAELVLSSATVLPQPRPVAPFQLVDENKKVFSNAGLENQWSLIFFGFTNCPQLCPTTLTTLKQVYQKLEHDQVKPLPQVLFISVDPERDNAKRIKEYLAGFNPNFVGATGTKVQLDQLTQQFNVVYAKVFANSDQSNYSVEHSGTILMVDPQGQLYAIFSTPHNAANIADDYEKIVTR